MKLKFSNLTKSYADAGHELVVLNRVNFEFASGKKVAVVGRSGVGKSTFLHILGGLDKPSSGAVWYDDTDIFAIDDEERSRFRGRSIGFVFQFHHLLHEFDALENVAMPLYILGIKESEAKDRAREILDRVGLNDRFHHRPGQLSGGEQQRVAIARAVVTRPNVLLADEPTGNLDLETASQVQDLLWSVQQELGSTLILVTHSMELARTTDIVYEMVSGGDLRALS